jgi:hypothetical protein
MTAPGVAGFQWRMPVDVRFGAGCTSELAAQLGERSAVVMAFEPATTLGWRAQWTRDLGQRLRAWVELPDGLSSMARCREFAEQVWPVLAAEAGTGGGGINSIASPGAAARPRAVTVAVVVCSGSDPIARPSTSVRARFAERLPAVTSSGSAPRLGALADADFAAGVDDGSP